MAVFLPIGIFIARIRGDLGAKVACFKHKPVTNFAEQH
jgi:hypothetical protein